MQALSEAYLAHPTIRCVPVQKLHSTNGVAFVSSIAKLRRVRARGINSPTLQTTSPSKFVFSKKPADAGLLAGEEKRPPRREDSPETNARPSRISSRIFGRERALFSSRDAIRSVVYEFYSSHATHPTRGEPGPPGVKEALHAKCAREASTRYVLRPSKVESLRSPHHGAGVSSH